MFRMYEAYNIKNHLQEKTRRVVLPLLLAIYEDISWTEK